MNVTHKITMDLTRPTNENRINVVEGDKNSRIVNVHLYENFASWRVPTNASVLVKWERESGVGGEYSQLSDGSSAWSAVGNVLTITLSEESTEYSGNVKFSIVLTTGDSQISTFVIVANVHAVANGREGANSGASSTDITGLQKQIGNLSDLETEDKSSLVSAINEAAKSGSGTGTDGDDGGYYTPKVSQPTTNTMLVEHTPSKSGMPAVEPVTINLPVGSGSPQNVNPVAKTEDMTQPVGVDADGRLWVAPIGGGSSGGETTPTTHGIVWNLLNVSSSNAVATVNHGASLSAVLTAASGYTLGDVTVTMGGEVLTGVWNADAATVTIASVTGDVVISCAGVEESAGEPADTSPVIAQPNMKISGDGSYKAASTLCVTKAYEYRWDNNALKALPQYDAANDYINTSGYQGAINVYLAFENHVAAGNAIVSGDTDWGNVHMGYSGDGEFIIAKNYCTSAKEDKVESMPVPNKESALCNSDVVGIEFTLFAADVEGSYAYWSKPYAAAILPIGVNAGDVIFAGKDSPYYGMKNIDGTMLSEASVAGLSIDEDYAQDYSVATTSLLGEDPAPNADVYAGVSDDFAAVINTAKKEWMTEYGGDYRKIPLIVSTDQHGRTSGIFNLLSRILNMHDVSKICNLGDTVTDKWYDGEPDKPLLTCSELDKWLECMKTIPFSKRLDVFGNHDAWYGDGTTGGNPIGTAYPSNLSHLDQYFRNIYARRTNNSGWFAVRDDYFNVKYVVVTGFEWVNGSAAYRIGTAQMKSIIDEFGKDDGYDIVVVSHVPVYYQDSTETFPTGMTPETPGSTAITRVSALNTDLLFNARKNKTAGTITDSEGVEHTFDFSGCGTDILCALHGHMHVDGYNYVGGDGLLSAAFDWFSYETFFMVLIDRVERKLDVWKLNNTPQSLRYQIPLDKPAK